jgi:cytochrome c peroxidase
MVKRAVVVGSLAVALAGITLAGEAGAQAPRLSPLQVSGPTNLGDFVRDDEAAKVLGEALFWDSSDGVQACATCHFRAGADPRRKNQISPDQIGPVVSAPTSTSMGWDRTTGSAVTPSPSGSSQIPRITSRP